MLIKRNIRRILQNIPEKNTKDVLEEIILILEELDGEKTHLATKDDIKQVIEMMNARFEAMEKANTARFELVMKENIALRQEMNARFEAMEKTNAARFEAIDKRFEAMEKNNAIRFESLEKRLAFMQWLIGGGVLLVALKLFFPHIFPH
jgi:hypothetical protein